MEKIKFVKITEYVPVEEHVRPEIGKVYPVVSADPLTKLYFIEVNEEQVGVFLDRECRAVDSME